MQNKPPALLNTAQAAITLIAINARCPCVSYHPEDENSTGNLFAQPTTHYTYDPADRLIQLTGEQQRLMDPISDANPTSFTHATQHAHDVLGNRTGITLPGIDSTLRVLWEEQLH